MPHVSNLDWNWLDATTDLNPLLAKVPVASVTIQQQTTPEQSHVVLSIPEDPEVCAQDLLEQPGVPILACVDAAADPDRMLEEVLNKLTAELPAEAATGDAELALIGQDLPSVPVEYLPTRGELSPVSVEDVETLLSEPGSPSDSGSTSFEDLLGDPDYEPEESSVGPVKRPTRNNRSPTVNSYSGDIQDRKQRKKLQNKTAASRYRQKKKSEQHVLDDECKVLEERNKELNEQVDSISREIKYLKNLMSEIENARSRKR